MTSRPQEVKTVTILLVLPARVVFRRGVGRKIRRAPQGVKPRPSRAAGGRRRAHRAVALLAAQWHPSHFWPEQGGTKRNKKEQDGAGHRVNTPMRRAKCARQSEASRGAHDARVTRAALAPAGESAESLPVRVAHRSATEGRNGGGTGAGREPGGEWVREGILARASPSSSQLRFRRQPRRFRASCCRIEQPRRRHWLDPGELYGRSGDQRWPAGA